MTPSLDPWTFSFPHLPPTTNHAYMTIRGRRVLSSLARAFKMRVGAAARRLLLRSPRVFPLAPLVCRVTLLFPSDELFTKQGAWKAVDAENRSKLVVDAVMEALGVDDRYVVCLSVEKRVGVRPEVRVQIEGGVLGYEGCSPLP